MATAELSPLVPFPEQAGQLGTLEMISDNLEEFRADLLTGSLYAKYAGANPREAARLEAYWYDASLYPAAATMTGQAIRAAYQAHHQAMGG